MAVRGLALWPTGSRGRKRRREQKVYNLLAPLKRKRKEKVNHWKVSLL